MISIGRSLRWYNRYEEEIAFSVQNHFDFMQVWFKDGEIKIDNVAEPKEEFIKQKGFPIILHALFDLQDFDLYGDRLLEIVKYLEGKDVIIHPICHKSQFCSESIYELAKQVKNFSEKAKKAGIVWYLENNSVMENFHYRKEELAIVFSEDSYVEQLLDVAHIDDYQHLEDIIAIKYPKCLHVAGKHFGCQHEHLSLTKGDVDYQMIFQKYLKNYNGRIILEVIDSDEEIVLSKQIIDNAIRATC